ncbi:phytoene desaturase family protein [Niallia sp. Krafla_26]|uniref:phytoene desaturase family protein n=1 Tax=Niallia sp. Krafla_26 TaxID=3064703 RepID=UPI003D17ACCC
MTQMWDVVIVGGGLAGYVAANALAKRKGSIVILEKGKDVGGRARTNRIHGQYFNLGPHAFYKKGKAKTILEEMGIRFHGKSPKLGGVLIENQIEYSAPFTPLGFFSTNLLNGKERMEWVKVLFKMTNMDSEKLTNQTFQQWVKQIAKSDKVQSLLYLLGRLATYCHAPEKVSAKIMVSHMKAVMGGVLYLDGGWQSLVDQLHNRAVSSGVKVQTHTVVKQIIAEEQQIRLVLSDGKDILGKHVIYTSAPNELPNMVHCLKSSFFTNTIPVTGSTLDVALSQLPNPKRLFAMNLSDPLYYSVHSNVAKLSDDGKSIVLHLFKYHHPDEHIDGKRVQKELHQFLEKLQPDWQKYQITSRYIPRLIVNQRFPQIGDEKQLLRSKTEIPGLYIAGDWASPHSILAEGAVTSGLQAAQEILEKKR